MKSILANRWLLFSLRIILGGIFAYAGAVKIQTPQTFADSIAAFQLLPPQLINLLAMALPPLEIVTGVMLILGWRKRLASFAVLVLCIVFLVALATALLRNIPVDCGCFGSSQPSHWSTMIGFGRDILLTFAAYLLYQQRPPAPLAADVVAE